MRNTHRLQRGTATIMLMITPTLLCCLAPFALGWFSAQSVSVMPIAVQPTNTPQDSALVPGDVVAAESLDRDGCAVNVTDTFGSNDTFYIVMEDSAIPEGTSIFARLYEDGVAVEDTDEIVADQDYTNVCVNFAFESNTSWNTGDYEAQFFINGSAYLSVFFTVR